MPPDPPEGNAPLMEEILRNNSHTLGMLRFRLVLGNKVSIVRQDLLQKSNQVLDNAVTVAGGRYTDRVFIRHWRSLNSPLTTQDSLANVW